MEEIIIVTLTTILFLVLPIPVAVILGLLVVMRIGYLAYQKGEVDENTSLEPQFLGAGLIAIVIAYFIPYVRVQLLLSYVTVLSLFRFCGRGMAIRRRMSVKAQNHNATVNADMVEKLIDKKMDEYFCQLDLLKDKLNQTIDSTMEKASGLMSGEEVEALLIEARMKSENAVKEATAKMEAEFEIRKNELQSKYDSDLKREKHKIEKEAANQASNSEEARKNAEIKLREVQKKLEIEREENSKRIETVRDDAYKKIEALKSAHEAKCMEMQNTINSLNEKIRRIHEEQDVYIQELESKYKTQNEIVENTEIRKRFDKALGRAKKELDIFSPWMNHHVVNNDLKNKIEILLKRGVVVKIRYGIGLGSGSGNQDRNSKTEMIAKELSDRFSKYKNFHIYKDNSHAKLYICDDEFYVLSSFNILSYDGGVNSKDKRGEIGECSTNKTLLEAYRNKFFFF